MDVGNENKMPVEILCALNRGFGEILSALAALERVDSIEIRSGFIKGLTVVVEEARAWANFELAIALRDGAEIDWHRFGQLRRQLENDRQ